MRSWKRVAAFGFALLAVGGAATALQTGWTDGLAHDAAAIAGVILLGVGGSTLASALVTRLVTNQVFGIDIGDAVEALRGASPFTRTNQRIEILLELRDGEVCATAQHRFELLTSVKFKRKLWFHIYTDLAQWGSGAGFNAVVEPDGHVLEGDELGPSVRKIRGKWQFQKQYEFRPRQSSEFVFETFGFFRRSDRLIWTVEQISSDFAVRIVDRRGVAGPVKVRINHHRASQIDADMRRHSTPNGRVIEFACNGEVLPYQGFELQWSDGEEA